MTHKSSRSSSLLGRACRAGFAGIGSLALFAAMSSGCLDRPVAPAQPGTTNIFVDQIIQTAVDKIDLLFMIDNSRSMADKQQILQDAVPVLLNRLISPLCVDPQGNLSDPPCGNGTEPEFKPIDDIHIGIVTSSLGGHGADTCSPAQSNYDESENDRAQLLPSVRPNIPQYTNSGFLVWDPSGKHQPQGEQNPGTLVDNFRTQIIATGEIGCGFEASLEAWYRFLIDPEPPSDVTVVDNQAQVARPNQTVLTQRAQFLRPDSLVAVIMLTDENDCSTVDGGIAWLAGQSSAGGRPFTLPRATAACEGDPNNGCCRSCSSIETGPPAGCAPLAEDPGCTPQFHPVETDELNLRCWDQKRRYGVDFLYDINRYVRGLTSPTVLDSQNIEVPNPLYQDLGGNNQPPRPQNLVFLAGIIGVPWQDIATDATIDPGVQNLEYLTAQELRDPEKNRWAMILGDPRTGVRPTDALMIESPFDRTTLPGVDPNHPLGIGSLAPAPADGQPPSRANPINGNEYIPRTVSDLQYACIFERSSAIECGDTQGCDCSTIDQGRGKPLCQGTQQTHAKAYPGIRHLQVLKGIGEVNSGVDNAIVASICPKILNSGNPAYGYNPAVAAIIDRLKEQLGGKCLPRPLAVDDQGNVPCAVVEALFSPGSCNCDGNQARGFLDGEKASLIEPVLARMSTLQMCGGNTGRACEDFCLCEILPAAGQARETCLNDGTAVNTGNQFGYCYLQEDPPIGNTALVQECPLSQRRKLQFIGQNTPQRGSVAFIACLGKPAATEVVAPPPDPGP